MHRLYSHHIRPSTITSCWAFLAWPNHRILTIKPSRNNIPRKHLGQSHINLGSTAQRCPELQDGHVPPQTPPWQLTPRPPAVDASHVDCVAFEIAVRMLLQPFPPSKGDPTTTYQLTAASGLWQWSGFSTLMQPCAPMDHCFWARARARVLKTAARRRSSGAMMVVSCTWVFGRLGDAF
jgi:hypothetical protein